MATKLEIPAGNLHFAEKWACVILFACWSRQTSDMSQFSLTLYIPVLLSTFVWLNVIFICFHRCLKDEVHLEFHGFHVGLSTCGKMRLFNFFFCVNIDRVACSDESRFMQLHRSALISDKKKIGYLAWVLVASNACSNWLIYGHVEMA